MPRTSRICQRDTIYHVTARGVDGRAIYHDDDDRRYFIARAKAVFEESKTSLFAYCLMNNHFHMLVSCSGTPLGVPLHRTLTAYSVRFNAKIERTGHLFQSRFYSHPVTNLPYLHNAVAYIHANPVRAQLVAAPGDWEWSSHHDWVSLSKSLIDFTRLEKLCGIAAADLSYEYERRASLMASTAPRGMTIEQLIEDTAGMLGLSPDALLTGQKGVLFTKAKRLLVERAKSENLSIRSLAIALKCSPAALTMLRKRTSEPVPFVN